jgi:protein-S-isoprenylcysteine O-methyltransferase Ste14
VRAKTMAYERFAEERVDVVSNSWFNLYRSVTTLFGMALFLVVVPLFFLLASCGIEEYLLTHRFRVLQIMLGLFSLAYGFITVILALVSQLQTGQRTLDPVASTQKSTLEGSYFRCRNPLLLGAIIYCFGIGTILGSITTGLTMSFLILVLGTCYVKFIEKKELYIRLGHEHEEYRQKTPFLILRF